MPRGPEFEGQPQLSEGSTRHRRKEIPQFEVVKPICHGVEVVKMSTGERKYHVTWERETGPAHMFLPTAQKVLDTCENVIKRYLGRRIPLNAEKLLEISGETQKMTQIYQGLLVLAQRHLVPLTPETSEDLKNGAQELSEKLGQVTNKHKLVAKRSLQSSTTSPEKKKQEDEILRATIAILDRNRECVEIVRGTLSRFWIVSFWREQQEGVIIRSHQEIARALFRLEQIPLSSDEKEQIAREISGKGWGTWQRLSSLNGPEYTRRASQVKNLAGFGDILRKGEEKKAKRVLENALGRLERVLIERAAREKTRGER